MTVNRGGTARGRRSFGSYIDVNIRGVERTFPGQIRGLSLSNPQAQQAGQDQRQFMPDGSVRILPAAAAAGAQQRTLTLQLDVVEDSPDYKAIAALENTTTQMMVRQRRDEIQIAPETSSGNTVAVTTDFVPTFAGDNHPTNVPELAYLDIGGKVFRLRTLTVPANAAANVTRNSALPDIDVALDREGRTAGGVYKEGAAATLSAAVDASTYRIVAAATARDWFACRVLNAPLMGDFSGGEQGDYVTANVVLELVGVNVPPLIPVALPEVA